jgi:electron transport complex protein RnfG
MTQEQLFAAPPPPKIWQMYRALVGVGLLGGLLIVTVFEYTRPIIEQNHAEALRRAIFQVLPAARSSASYRLDEAGGFVSGTGAESGEELIYACYDEEQRLVGFAVQAEGMGYQDTIRLLYGYSFAEDAITGIRVLESRETPGLGDKIETDAAFLVNFERLDVSLAGDLSGLANLIEYVKPGTKQHPWQIDGITGATISSTAVANILRKSSARWIPQIKQNLDDFAGAE